MEDSLQAAALPMGAGCAMLSQPAGPAQDWGADATGLGIVTATNALNATW